MNGVMEKVLRKTPLFSNLTQNEMEALAARVSTKHFARGEQLFAEGDPCTGLFLVASGKIRIFKLSPAGREQVLAVEGPGSSFAELPVFDGGNYPAAASALEDAEVLFISRKDFQNFCREHPEVALKVIAVVGSRLRRLVGIIEELSVHNGTATADFVHFAPGAGERIAFPIGNPLGIDEEPSGVGGGLGDSSGIGVSQSEPAAGGRVFGSGWTQDRGERPGGTEG